MIRYFVLMFAVLLWPLASAQAWEDPLVAVMSPYAYATTSVQKNGAVFMVLQSNGAEDDRLLSAATDAAERTELHTHIMDGDTMMMRQVEGYDIPAGGETVLEPMGHHIMLFGLKGKLEPGTHFPMTLHFEKAGDIAITVSVIKPGEKPGESPAGSEAGDE